MSDFKRLEKKLSIEFKNKDLLKQAFVHRSYLNENPKFSLPHNERLEFLGDAVLELIVTEYLYQKYPKRSEGELTNWRAALVNAQSLAGTAKKLGFEEYLLLSRGEAKDTGKAREYILANTFEAFLGAFYLDQGLGKVREFIETHLINQLSKILKEGGWRDAKSRFQEEAQERVRITPTYKVLKEWGPDHAKHFVVGVFLGEELVAEGEGSSKQEAEEAAAREALKVKNW
ncbi:ribonuclease III [bacterium]|nr:ribonuclease III [bacterium]